MNKTITILSLIAAGVSFAPAQTVEQRLQALEQKVAYLTNRDITQDLQITNLTNTVNKLKTDVATLVPKVATLTTQVATLQAKTKYMYTEGTTTLFMGTNVVIKKDGTNNDTTPNGLGNLILGYNKMRTDEFQTLRGGSHNLIIGNEHNYQGSGNFVGGFRNWVKSNYNTILTGTGNTASVPLSGGMSSFGVILGGSGNHVQEIHGLIGTGHANYVGANYGAVLTGKFNTVADGGNHQANYGFIATGEHNRIKGWEGAIMTGDNLTVQGNQGFLGTGTKATLAANRVFLTEAMIWGHTIVWPFTEWGIYK